MKKLLNFGCGGTFHPAWTNVDGNPVDPTILRHDLRKGLPFGDATFDGAYGSHVLEHLEPAAGARLLEECFRVLKPGGILRLAVPDLEAIARLYLATLEQAVAGDAAAAQRYEWALLELYDQAVRSRSGGRMAIHLASATGEHARFVASRVGDEAQQPVPVRRKRTLGGAMRQVRQLAAGWCAALFLGAEGREALREGLFRRGGELHQWMYDRHSVARALQAAGFADVRIAAADESAIPGFAAYGLETRDGRARKPDSLYAEATRP